MSPLRSLPPNVQPPELLNFEISGNASMLVDIFGVANFVKLLAQTSGELEAPTNTSARNRKFVDVLCLDFSPALLSPMCF